MAPVIRECQRRGLDYSIIHTGQHYSYQMDRIFFEHLELPQPDHDLDVGSGNHGEQTGRILADLEAVLMAERPDVVLVLGDTNTVMAGALAASKLHIKVNLVKVGTAISNVYPGFPVLRQDHASECAAVIPKFVSAYLAGKAPVIFGDGVQTRDFVYVKDVVRANILASEGAVPGVYNIASGTRTSLNELAEMIRKISGNEIRPIYSEARAGDIRDSVADITKAEEMGYSPEYSLKRGLQRKIEYQTSCS